MLGLSYVLHLTMLNILSDNIILLSTARMLKVSKKKWSIVFTISVILPSFLMFPILCCHLFCPIWRTSFSNSSRAGLLAINSLHFSSPENVSISLHYWQIFSLGNEFQLTVLFSQPVRKLWCFLLASMTYGEKSTVI